MTVALYAQFTAATGNLAQVTDLIAAFAAEVRAEPGNLVFDPHTRADSPETIFVYEVYRDQQSFERHLASLHGHEFNRVLNPLVIGGGSELSMLLPIPVSVNAPVVTEPQAVPS